MNPHEDEATRFRETWPLHALRYGLILAGVFAWLWDAAGADDVLVGALLFSMVALVELPLHGPSRRARGFVWAALQTGLGAAAFYVSPGLGAALVVCAVVGGIAVAVPRSWAMGSVVLLSVVTAPALAATRDIGPALALIGAYALSAWVGRLFAVRIEERRAHRRTVSELEEAQARLSRLAETTRELAAARERERISEEIHDTVGHALVATLLQVQVARKLAATDPSAAERRLDLIEKSVRETLERVRQSLHRGRRDREQLPLTAALESLAADFQAAGGPEVQLSLGPDSESVEDVTPEVADVLYRTVQEALTNAVRHGNASLVRIEAETAGRRLTLRIADDGVGASTYTPGMGLTGMVSRVQSVGGTLRFQTAAGRGFQVEVGVRRR